MKINLQGGAPLFISPAAPGGNPTTIPGSTDLGTYNTGGFSRLRGMFSVTGSVTVRYQMGVWSGQYLVSSSVVINSGPAVFDVLNLGRYTNVSIIAANSQTPTYFVSGEPIR